MIELMIFIYNMHDKIESYIGYLIKFEIFWEFSILPLGHHKEPTDGLRYVDLIQD